MEQKIFRDDAKISFSVSPSKLNNAEFALVDIRLCYAGRNRNYSDLSKEVIESALPTLVGCPIVGEYIYEDSGHEEGHFGSHGGRIILDDSGIRYEQTTVPFGFIPEKSVLNAEWVPVTEKNGLVRDYLTVHNAIVWAARYPELNDVLDEKHGQSFEITIPEYHYDGDYLVADKINFSACCILGSAEPCFESASIGAIRDYSLDSYKQQFTEMLEKYKQYESDSKSVQNKETKIDTKNVKGEQDMQLSKFVEVLSAVKIEETEDCKYTLLSATDTQVFALDMEDFKPYGFDYAVVTDEDAEKIVIDFDSKVEMSLSATEKIADEDFVEFSIKSEIENRVNSEIDTKAKDIEKVFNEKYETLASNYDTLNQSYESVMDELKSYKKAEADAKAKLHEEEVNELFDKYAEKLGKCAEFLVYKAKVDPAEVSTDEVNEKLTLMYGKYMMETSSKKSFSYEPSIANVKPKSNSGSGTSRYGHLLDKYMK